MLIDLITVQALMAPNKVIPIMTSNMTSLCTNYIRTVSSKFVRYNLKVVDLTSILLIVALPQVGNLVSNLHIYGILYLKLNHLLNLELLNNINVICKQVLVTISTPESFPCSPNIQTIITLIIYVRTAIK